MATNKKSNSTDKSSANVTGHTAPKVNPLFAPSIASGPPPNEENDSRKRLLQTALVLFAENGFDGVSTRDIAAKAQVNISLISYYFKGKEGLYLAVLEEFTSESRQRLKELFESFDLEGLTRDLFVERMTLVIEGMLEMKMRSPHVSALIHRELLAGFPQAKEFVNQVFSNMAMTIINFLLAAQKKGIIRKDLHIPTHFLTMVHGMDTYFLFNRCEIKVAVHTLRLPENNKEYVRQMVMIFIEGVLE